VRRKNDGRWNGMVPHQRQKRAKPKTTDTANGLGRTTIVSHLSLYAGETQASHNLGFSPIARRRRLARPAGRLEIITPARTACSMCRLKRRRMTKERRIMADDTNSNKNSVARNVNLLERPRMPSQREKSSQGETITHTSRGKRRGLHHYYWMVLG
jgi:hypothetical protein